MEANRLMKALARWLFLPLVAALVAGMLAGELASADPIRISDGDTFWLGEEHIRLWGIDAPEWDTKAGRASEQFLRESLSGLRSGDLFCERRYRDPYDRWVARCFLPSGEDLACVLVSYGHAKDWPRYSGGFYQRCERSDPHS